MSEGHKIAKSTLVEVGAVVQGSAHLLIEPIGPLSAGNNFNWWNLVIVEPGKSVTYERRGCYGVYVARGRGVVIYSGAAGVAVTRTISDENKWETPESKVPGVFSIEIKNELDPTLNKVTVPLVAFVLLAVDPGTTPGPK